MITKEFGCPLSFQMLRSLSVFVGMFTHERLYGFGISTRVDLFESDAGEAQYTAA